MIRLSVRDAQLPALLSVHVSVINAQPIEGGAAVKLYTRAYSYSVLKPRMSRVNVGVFYDVCLVPAD